MRFAQNILKTVVAAVVMIGSSMLVAYGQVNTEQVLRIGQNALYFEDYMLSIQYFNQAISAKPYLAQPYLMRSIAKLNLDDFSGAEADATKAIELNPYLTDAYEVRGVARQNSGKSREAIADYDKALEFLPRNRQLLFNKALALTELHDYAEASQTFGTLLRHYPNFAAGYLGKARLELADADTVAAVADIDKALTIDRKDPNAYIMRADIAIHSQRDYETALADIDEAIKLQPRAAGLYINRAFLRYNLDNYTGAMADYDYALELEPLNPMALFNRALLLAEVSANDLALNDFNKVLELDPDDYRALFNRAQILKAKGDYSGAEADAQRVVERFEQLPEAYYLRGSIREARGHLDAAEADYRRARSIARSLQPNQPEEAASPGQAQQTASGRPQQDDDTQNESPLSVSRRFATLLTVNDNAEIQQQFNNQAIRGRVQDRRMSIEPEGLMMLSFYNSPSELRPGGLYIREVDELNATRALRFILMVTNTVPSIDENTANRHFQSIDYYNSYLATHSARPVDYIGRALDLLTVRDYAGAERDARRALELAPDLTLGHLVMAQALYGKYVLEKENHNAAAADDARMREAMARSMLDDVEAEYRRALELSPHTAVAYYNLGHILYEKGDATGAIGAYDRAIAEKNDFGEAFFNRGFIKLSNGDRSGGIADLSKAGELGIIPAYNLIKRLSR